MTVVAELPLVGAGGEPIDFARTIVSHGVAELPPNRLDLEARTLEATLPIAGVNVHSNGANRMFRSRNA